MSVSSPDAWQPVFFGVASLVVLVQAWRGWQMGVVRQIMQILALGAGYVAAWFGGPHLAALLRPLGLPDVVLTAVGGAIIGMSTFVLLSILSAILFKKTGDQSIGVVRLGYGFFGSVAGFGFGVFLVWIVVLAIRLLGTLAESEMRPSRRRERVVPGTGQIYSESAPPSNMLIQRLAEIKQSLDQGTAGSIIHQVDPVPGEVYRLIEKVGSMASSAQSLERFMTYPGVRPLTEHPRIRALQQDADIARYTASQDIMSLLRHPRLVEAANDPEVVRMVRQLEFEKALDYALAKTEKPSPASHGR